MGAKIGIGITTHNRREVALHAVDEWAKNSPKCKIVVIDDASEIPFPAADFRFEKQVGIARAKNKCLELLDDCDYIFLADDDIWPTRIAWMNEYVQSGVEHACYIFDRKGSTEFLSDFKNGICVFSFDLPRGCLLFFTKKCLETAGGFDVNFTLYGYEHAELSRRIYNMGLTAAPYIDVAHGPVFYSMDEHKRIVSSVKGAERNRSLIQNKKHFDLTANSKEYKPYK